MTEGKTFKRRVRDRMAKTGESYTTAHRQVTEKRDRNAAARERLAGDRDLPPDASVLQATGKGWDDWFVLLDAWGARDRKHGEVARFLVEEHAVPGWWAQSITVAYERARGLRMKHQRPDGFSVSASKTIGVPVDVLFAAFVDDVDRERWLSGATMSLRTAQPKRTARFDWEDGTTRVNVGFVDKGPSKSQVTVAHEKLADAADAEEAKLMWRQRLADLKALLES